ncbi:MAG: heavy-metal-associated domain-containing protein [Phenylobacterium sp.]|uniref:heavy-metal-associated domain-containing protein n=1 Tax=Phenylobacterium sp. TaxID=1871053 RepID=UPI002727F1D9|nr:heavy-metal-associated domain-containing protein [Phenylobacterium sp.]MDO8914006.1 heavy-metal-associated domain-containing protein [Phenylobacterium sp.]MDO9248547.1 heavy-metal-associated domain-containing protein [Phenylobacterium sp.]MDP3099754.1 heavy-metal-associated domain-containing protein [Phenylobacterium sp.]
MLNLKVPDMTCGHCEGVVTRAVHSVDSSATLTIDLPSHMVSIITSADHNEVIQAMDAAGYPAEPN